MTYLPWTIKVTAFQFCCFSWIYPSSPNDSASIWMKTGSFNLVMLPMLKRILIILSPLFFQNQAARPVRPPIPVLPTVCGRRWIFLTIGRWSFRCQSEKFRCRIARFQARRWTFPRNKYRLVQKTFSSSQSRFWQLFSASVWRGFQGCQCVGNTMKSAESLWENKNIFKNKCDLFFYARLKYRVFHNVE